MERVDYAVSKEQESGQQQPQQSVPIQATEQEKKSHQESDKSMPDFRPNISQNVNFVDPIRPSVPPQFYEAPLPSQSPSQQPYTQVIKLIAFLFCIKITLFQNNGHYVPMDMLRLRQQHQQELEMVREFNQSKVNMLEQQNRLLYNAGVKRLESNLANVEEKYTRRQRHEPVCVEAEKNVESCYLQNSGMPLKCSKQAQDFINCIDSIRRQVL